MVFHQQEAGTKTNAGFCWGLWHRLQQKRPGIHLGFQHQISPQPLRQSDHLPR